MQWRRIRASPGPLFALALAAGALVSTSTARAAEVGVNVTATSGDYFTSTNVRDAIGEARPAWVRVFLGWNAIEPQRGVYNTAEIQNYQRLFASLPAGTKIDVDVEGTPAWAAGGSSDIRTPPANDDEYAGFVNYLVNAFNGRVTAWEIWNEEDSSAWWTGTPAQYAALLSAAYPAIKSADPNATVIIGGLTGNDAPYVSQLYADGARGSFDAVGVHTDTACNVASPYSFEYNRGTRTINQYFFLGFTAIHDVMVAAGDAAKPIYMTEIGWAATGAECPTGVWAGQKPAGVTEQTQATYLQQAYHCLAQPQYAYVKAAMWFGLFDGTSNPPLDSYGLLNADYSPKPAFGAFQQESLDGDPLSGPCGNAIPPAIRILRPTPGAHYRGPLRIAVLASSPANGVREVTIGLAGHSRVHFVSKGSPGTLSASIAWRSGDAITPGPHTLEVTVTDKLGNVATKTIRVVRLASPARTVRH